MHRQQFTIYDLSVPIKIHTNVASLGVMMKLTEIWTENRPQHYTMYPGDITGVMQPSYPREVDTSQ